MDSGPNMFFSFIIERTQDDKKEAMAGFLKEAFKPPEDGNFDPDGFRKINEVIMSMLKPEAAEEFRKMMNPFDDEADEIDETLMEKNYLAQQNKDKWRNDSQNISRDEMRAALACSRDADKMKCDCWNTYCQFYGNCRKCMVFHLCLRQFPTCQRSLLGEYEEHYIAFSRDK